MPRTDSSSANLSSAIGRIHIGKCQVTGPASAIIFHAPPDWKSRIIVHGLSRISENVSPGRGVQRASMRSARRVIS